MTDLVCNNNAEEEHVIIDNLVKVLYLKISHF